MNSEKASFSVHDIVCIVEVGEWDNFDIGIELLDSNGFESAEDSGDEDFGGKHLSITFFSYFLSHLIKFLHYLSIYLSIHLSINSSVYLVFIHLLMFFKKHQ